MCPQCEIKYVFKYAHICEHIWTHFVQYVYNMDLKCPNMSIMWNLKCATYVYNMGFRCVQICPNVKQVLLLFQMNLIGLFLIVCVK